MPQGGQTTATRQEPVYEDFVCTEDGLFEDSQQCDLYWGCKGTVATPNYCEDGLVFDIFKARAGHVDPCDTPFVVDCTDRPLMREYQRVAARVTGSALLPFRSILLLTERLQPSLQDAGCRNKEYLLQKLYYKNREI